MAIETQYVLSYSYGKDSGACIHVVKDILGLPLDRIVTADVWATPDIPADMPEMWEWKQRADQVIFDRWGIKVEHVCALKKAHRITEGGGAKLAYADLFYQRKESAEYGIHIAGFPKQRNGWCHRLKYAEHGRDPFGTPDVSGYILPMEKTEGTEYISNIRVSDARRELVYRRTETSCDSLFSKSRHGQGANLNTVQYIGIAADEPERIERHSKKPDIRLPLVEAGWTEAMCREWCEQNDLLAPTYTTSMRGGCWFCHNQGIQQLRLLRRDHPELWKLLLKWDSDSPVTFKADGHTVHDFDRRFALEDEGWTASDEKFRWEFLNKQQITFDVLLRRAKHG